MTELFETIQEKLKTLTIEEQERFLVETIAKIKDAELIKKLEDILKEIRAQIIKDKGRAYLEKLISEGVSPEKEEDKINVQDIGLAKTDYEQKDELEERLPKELLIKDDEYKVYEVKKAGGDYISKSDALKRVSDFLRENPTVDKASELDYIRKLSGIDDYDRLCKYAAEVNSFMSSDFESPDEWIKKYARK